MKRRFNQNENNDELRNKIIGLGDSSFSKSYYPELQKRIDQLQLFRSAFKQINDLLIIVEKNSEKITEINELAKQFIEEKPNQNATVFFGEKNWDKIKQYFSEENQRSSLIFSSELQNLNNETIPVEISISTINNNNQIYYLAIVRDITERLRNELEIKKSEERHRLLAENTLDLICLHQIGGNLTYVSPSIKRILGYEINEILGKSPYNFIHKEDFGKLKLINRLLELKKNSYITKTFRILAKNGKYIWFESYIKPLLDAENNIIAYQTSSRDISKRKMAEKTILKAKEKAEEADKLKTAFLANMSHEIRTPMNAIIGFSNLLSIPNISEEDRNMYISRINENGDSLLSLIDDIIDIAKIEANIISIKKKNVKLLSILQELFAVYKTIIFKKQNTKVELRLNKNNIENEFEIYTDPIRLRQILSNLLSNAVKYTEEGFIEISVKKENDHLIFCIKDTGIGIDKKYHKDIFKRFIKVENTREKLYRGAGLGLSIAHNLVKFMGGDIWLESELRKGSSFYFSLLIEDKADKTTIKKSGENTKLELTDKTILIAEDDDANFFLLNDILARTGVKILRAKNGKEAVNILNEKEKIIDLILMDIRMPLMDGFEATKLIRKKNKKIPIIAQTAYAYEYDIQTGREKGCTDYITKPIKISALLNLMKKYLY